MPQQILCYIGKSGTLVNTSWAATVKPTSTAGASMFMGSYDPAVCEKSKQPNTTMEYMVFTGWNTGGTIGSYGWVYTSDPRTGAAPFVNFELGIAWTSTTAGTLTLTYAQTGVGDLNEGQSISNIDTCGRIEAQISNNDFSGYTYYSSMQMRLGFGSSTFGSGWSGNISVDSSQTMAAVADMTSNKAQTMHRTSMTVHSCSLAYAHGYASMTGTQVCQLMESQLSGQNLAGVVAWTDNRGAIQSANSSAALGVNNGNSNPTYCVDRTSIVEYPRSYTAFDATTGAYLPSSISALYFNTSATDRGGRAWDTLDGSYWYYNASTGYHTQYSTNPAMDLYCSAGRDGCSVYPGSEADLNGDGVQDGYFANNSLPDGVTVTSRLGPSSTAVLRATDITEVPAPLDASSCGLTVSATSTDPASLTCGAANGNKAWAVPTIADVPGAMNFVNGVAQATA